MAGVEGPSQHIYRKYGGDQAVPDCSHCRTYRPKRSALPRDTRVKRSVAATDSTGTVISNYGWRYRSKID